MRKRQTVELRESHFQRFKAWLEPGRDDRCWEWTRCRDNHGYGVIHGWCAIAKNSRNARAHRVSYTLANGPIPAGMDVMHLCHNPSCVNPKHLRPGTRAENMRTSLRVGRLQRRIPLASAPDIIQRRSLGHTLQEIASDYGCSKQAVSRMFLIHGGRDVAVPQVFRGKIHPREYEKIQSRRDDGETLAEIAVDYGVAFQTIAKVLNKAHS